MTVIRIPSPFCCIGCGISKNFAHSGQLSIWYRLITHVFCSSLSLFHGPVQQRNIGRAQSTSGVVGGRSRGILSIGQLRFGVGFCSGDEVVGESGEISGSIEPPVKVPASRVSPALLGSDSGSQELGQLSTAVGEAIIVVSRAWRKMRSWRNRVMFEDKGVL